jgi:hypothetical protein
MQLCRAPVQPANRQIEAFYDRLLELLRLDLPRDGEWQLIECAPVWEGNPTWDSCIAFAWRSPDNSRCWLVIVNYAPHPSQCYLRLPSPEWAGATLYLNDLLSTESYSRKGDDLLGRGLYLDLPPWGCHVFDAVKGG